MATVVNNPQPVESSNNNGFLIGVILLSALVLFVIFYGLPRIGAGFGSSAPQVNVPGTINVHTGK